MATPKQTDDLYMGTALLYAKLSKAKRAQVGACLVTNNGVILGGVNGTAVDRPNECEDRIYPNEYAGDFHQHYDEFDAAFPFVDSRGYRCKLVTKPEVIHAELNCIMKAAREGVSCVDATVYVTLAPCVQCAAMMLQAGVKRVVYLQQYRDDSGVKLLQESNVVVELYDQL
jgi:dCMP deaminase